MLPVLTPHLSSYDYGINGVLFAYLGMADAFKDLGLSIIFVNSFYKFPLRFKFLWTRIFGFLQIWSVLFGLLLIPVVWLVLPKEEVSNVWLVTLFVVVPIMFFDPVIIVGMRYFQLNQQPTSFVTVAIISSLLAILVNYFTIVHWEMGYLGLLAGQFAAKAISFLIYFCFVFFKLKILPSYQFSICWIKKKIWLCAPMIPHFYSGYLLNVSDRVMLDLFKVDLSRIGVYAFAYTIGTYFSIIGKGMGDAATPLMMEQYKKGTIEAENNVRNMVWLMQGAILLAGLILCLWLKEIFLFVARNEELRDSYWYAIPVVMAYTYFPMYYGSNAKLRFNEKLKSIWKITFMAGLVSILINLIMIPWLGIAGAAITTFLGYMLMSYRGYWIKDFKKLNKTDYKPILWLTLAFIITVFAYLLADIHYYIKILLSLVILLGALVLYKKIAARWVLQTI